MRAAAEEAKAGTTSVWFQVEFLSTLEQGLWIPLYGRSSTVDGARENRRYIDQPKSRGEKAPPPTRIVRIEHTVEVIE